MRFLNQFVRFVGIGFLNTAVDFGVLNFFAASLNTYTGIRVGGINAISFAVAVVHSYFWSKSWVFAKEESGFFKNLFKFAGAGVLGFLVLVGVIWGSRQQYGPGFYLGMLAVLAVGELILWKAYNLHLPSFLGTQREIVLFAVVSLIGVFINSGIVAGATIVIPPQFGLNQELWTNLIKAAATAISLIWNFLGYKMLVFRR